VALLEVRNLSVHFGGLAAVNDVSFDVEQGDRLVIIGPNGAGKTTLFNLLTGQLKPSAGSVSFKGQDITGASVFSRTHMGMARSFQIASLFPQQTVKVNALIGLQGVLKQRYGMIRYMEKDRDLQMAARELLESVELWELRDEVVSSLAYGQQRQLEIALSLASGPELLLLDEPSCGLTGAESADITKRIKALGDKITVLMIAHDMDLVFGVAERVILLHYGQIACEGSCDEIRSNQLVKDIYMGSHKASTAGGLGGGGL
jgi:branched-chain amino acid transport system ATP-binding protein